MSGESTKFISIPEFIVTNKELNLQAKCVYGLINGLCYKYGYCWASNEYLASLLGLSTGQLKRYLKQLKNLGFLSVSGSTNNRQLRSLMIQASPTRIADDPSTRITNDPHIYKYNNKVIDNKDKASANASPNLSKPSSLPTAEQEEIPKAPRKSEKLLNFGKRIKMTAGAANEIIAKYKLKKHEFLEFCEEADNWLRAEGKTKKDYAAFMSNWIKKNLKWEEEREWKQQFGNKTKAQVLEEGRKELHGN